jgi:hypothetical protein
MEFPRQDQECLDTYLRALGMFSWHGTNKLGLLNVCCSLSLGKILESRERHSEFALCRELRTEFNNFIFGFPLKCEILEVRKGG